MQSKRKSKQKNFMKEINIYLFAVESKKDVTLQSKNKNYHSYEQVRYSRFAAHGLSGQR